MAGRLKSMPADVHVHTPQPARQLSVHISRGLVFGGLGRALLIIGGLCCCALGSPAQTSEPTGVDQPSSSWTAITDYKSDNLFPTRLPVRVIESHNENGLRALDSRLVQIQGTDGQLENYQDIEIETMQIDATTVRTVTRTFGSDVNGKRMLVQVTEEVKHILPGDASSVVRVCFNPDANGRLQPVQRDIVETRNTRQELEETNTTVMLPSVDGGLAPAFRTHETRKRATDGALETEKTTLLPDLNGKWQVSEIRRDTVTPEANGRSIEEAVFRPDAEGNLPQTSRVLSHEAESVTGKKQSSVETYSVDLPGTTRYGNLYLTERETSNSIYTVTGEERIEKKLEQINPGDPNAGLLVSVVVNDRMILGPTGEQSIVTMRARDSNGNFGIVSVDTTASDRIPISQIQQTPEQPK